MILCVMFGAKLTFTGQTTLLGEIIRNNKKNKSGWLTGYITQSFQSLFD